MSKNINEALWEIGKYADTDDGRGEVRYRAYRCCSKMAARIMELGGEYVFGVDESNSYYRLDFDVAQTISPLD